MDLGQHLQDIVDEPVAMRGVATASVIPAGPAPIQESHVVTRFAHSLAREVVPASVTLDAVQRNDESARRLTWLPMPGTQRVAIGGDEVFDLRGHVAPAAYLLGVIRFIGSKLKRL
jgi:hypothetical protein